MSLHRITAAIAVAALLLVPLAAAPARAQGTQQGTFAGCRWWYTVFEEEQRVAVGIADGASDGHGCTAAVISTRIGIANAVFVNDKSSRRRWLSYTADRQECVSFVVFGEAIHNFGDAMPSKRIAKVCLR